MPMEIIITTDLPHQHGHQPGILQQHVHQREHPLLNDHQLALQLQHDPLPVHQPVSPGHLLQRQIGLHRLRPVSQDHLLHRRVPPIQVEDQDQWEVLRPGQVEELAHREAGVEAEGVSLPLLMTRYQYFFIQRAYQRHPSLLHRHTGRLFFQTGTYSSRC